MTTTTRAGIRSTSEREIGRTLELHFVADTDHVDAGTGKTRPQLIEHSIDRGFRGGVEGNDCRRAAPR